MGHGQEELTTFREYNNVTTISHTHSARNRCLRRDITAWLHIAQGLTCFDGTHADCNAIYIKSWKTSKKDVSKLDKTSGSSFSLRYSLFWSDQSALRLKSCDGTVHVQYVAGARTAKPDLLILLLNFYDFRPSGSWSGMMDSSNVHRGTMVRYDRKIFGWCARLTALFIWWCYIITDVSLYFMLPAALRDEKCRWRRWDI